MSQTLDRSEMIKSSSLQRSRKLLATGEGSYFSPGSRNEKHALPPPSPGTDAWLCRFTVLTLAAHAHVLCKAHNYAPLGCLDAFFPTTTTTINVKH